MSRLLTGIKYHIKNSYPFHIKIYSDGVTLYTELNVIDSHHESHKEHFYDMLMSCDFIFVVKFLRTL